METYMRINLLLANPEPS